MTASPAAGVTARQRLRSSASGHRARHSERGRGSGTVLALALGGLLLTLSALLTVLAQAAVAGSRAATAADLAALAAADSARGIAAGGPCPVAAEVAARNGATLVFCVVSGPNGSIVEVGTSLPVSGLPAAASGRARAGPPDAGSATGGRPATAADQDAAAQPAEAFRQGKKTSVRGFATSGPSR
ncbi:hypothetical protein KIH31_01840 [Paenarthrobacter sp. DKR-5]|nr:hypothetical protein [Paenarthrobacter sp. DKR-5]